MQTFDYYPRNTGEYFETAERGLHGLIEKGRGNLLAVSLRGDQTWFGPYASLLGENSFEGIMSDERQTDELTIGIVEVLGEELKRRAMQPTIGITSNNIGCGFVLSLQESISGMVYKRVRRSSSRIIEERSNMAPVINRLEIIKASIGRIGLDTVSS